MRAALVASVAIMVLFGGTVLGLALRAPSANAQTVAGPTNCGDMAGPVWHFLVTGEKRGSTGSHYTVGAVNMPCATARALTARMIRKRSPGRGLNTKILPGYMCNISTPPGQLAWIGGCVAGKVMMPTSATRSFNWHHCEFVQGTGAHPTCRWTYFTP